MGVCERHERWKSHVFIGSNLRCRGMVGIDKLLDELRHIQVWIVLTDTGRQQSTPGPISSSLSCLILCTNSMSCLRKGGES